MKIPSPVSGPLADPARAVELATRDELELPEFTELTGVGAGKWGVYDINEHGVTIEPYTRLEDLPPDEQVHAQRLKREYSLTFPCTPEAFMTWFDATRATNGISDFALAPTFQTAVRRGAVASSAPTRRSYPSGDIVKAFACKPVPADNKHWWDQRLRDPRKYDLEDARALEGKAKRPSRWYPDVVGGWLVEKQHMSRDAVVGAVERHFPDVDANLI
jgi:hypothetical protein